MPGRPAGHSARHGHARPDPHVIVLFGATGDLAKRKLLPGLHHLFRAGLLPEQFRIIGSAPPEFALSDEDFRERAEAACDQFGNCKPDESWDSFASRLSFGAASPEDPSALVSAVEAAEKAISAAPGTGGTGTSRRTSGGCSTWPCRRRRSRRWCRCSAPPGWPTRPRG